VARLTDAIVCWCDECSVEFTLHTGRRVLL